MSRLLPMGFAVLSLAAVAGLASAQGPRGGQDANGDGVISAQEFEDAAKARFERMDPNHDGVIDAGELAAMEKRMEERRAERPDAASRPGGGNWTAMDADHDDKITQVEALAASKARFERLDADKDGKLSEAERPARRGPPN